MRFKSRCGSFGFSCRRRRRRMQLKCRCLPACCGCASLRSARQRLRPLHSSRSRTSRIEQKFGSKFAELGVSGCSVHMPLTLMDGSSACGCDEEGAKVDWWSSKQRRLSVIFRLSFPCPPRLLPQLHQAFTLPRQGARRHKSRGAACMLLACGGAFAFMRAWSR